MRAKIDFSSSSNRHCNIANNIHHGISITDENAGEIVCSRCGVVLEEKISSDAKPREKNSNGEMSGNSGSSTYLSSQHSLLSTSIGNSLSFSNVDHNGKVISSSAKNSFARLYRVGEIQRSKASNSQKRIIPAITILKGCTSKLNLPNSVFEDTITLYKRAHAAKLVRGRSTNGIAAACLYHICKTCDISKTMAEISEITGINTKKLFGYYFVLANSLGLGFDSDSVFEKSNRSSSSNSNGKGNGNKNGSNKNSSNSKDSLHRRYTVQIPVISSRLNIPQRIVLKSVEFLNSVNIDVISGKKPANTAAASIYMVCNMEGHHITQGDLAQVAGLTEAGIRNMIKVLKNK